MHTSGLSLGRLINMADGAMSQVIPRMNKMIAWQNDLHHKYVPSNDFKAMVYDMVTQGVFSGSQISNYLKCLDEEKAIRRGYPLDNATSLYNVHGAATRLMRGWNLLRVADATRNLNAIADRYLLSA